MDINTEKIGDRNYIPNVLPKNLQSNLPFVVYFIDFLQMAKNLYVHAIDALNEIRAALNLNSQQTKAQCKE